MEAWFDGRKKNTRRGRECGERRRSGTSTFRASCGCLEERRQPCNGQHGVPEQSLQVGKGAAGRLHVVSCYAPTRAASRETKDTFFQEIENILSAVPQGEKYVLMGDFNACVGSRECAGDLWDGVRGLHGYKVVNDTGKELLSFRSAHQATICNT